MLKPTILRLTQASRGTMAVLVLLSFSLFYPGAVSRLHAQTPAKAQASSPLGPPKEGIKVHGRWTIEIRNPDGKLVTRHQFENALTSTGATYLGGFLDRTLKAGEWRIGLDGSVSNRPCFFNGSQPSGCFIYETQSQSTVASDTSGFKTLTISSQSLGVTLSGTATAARTGAIHDVSTSLVRCAVDTQGICAETSSNGPFFERFTIKTLATPIDVVAGQIIQVTVVISFS